MCDCITKIQNQVLEEQPFMGKEVTKAELDVTFQVIESGEGENYTNSLGVRTYTNMSLTIEGKKKPHKVVVAHSFCPFCGNPHSPETQVDLSLEEINQAIKKLDDKNHVSDGYHTFGELYEHRLGLFAALCNTTFIFFKAIKFANPVWCSKKHSNGTSEDGWFIAGIGKDPGTQITYHLPDEYWNKFSMIAQVLPQAPEFDGHTSNDVLSRLSNFLSDHKK